MFVILLLHFQCVFTDITLHPGRLPWAMEFADFQPAQLSFNTSL